jgi:signal peptidase I
MNPTLAPGQLFVYDQTHYAGQPLHRGDVVVARMEGQVVVKRVYATGGESFWALCQVQDDTPVQDPIAPDSLDGYRRQVQLLRRKGRRDIAVRRITVPPGEVFLMGDGLGSWDSRALGTFPATAVLGKVSPFPSEQIAAAPDVEMTCGPLRRRKRSGPQTVALHAPTHEARRPR